MKLSLFILLLLLCTSVQAKILSSSDTHFVLRHEATSTLSTTQIWQRLIKPASWWHPEHTYSGDSNNLSLDANAGGLWLESWESGSVKHGEVLYIKNGKMLRLDAPFGPLQELGAYTIWTITIIPHGDGSKVQFDEVSSGPPSADLDEVAKAVDYVKGEAIKRLTR